MKRLSNFQSKCNNWIIASPVAITAFFMAYPAYAELKHAKDALEKLQDDLIKNIIPVAAAVILLCLAIGYAGRYIEKDTFVRWAVGVVIAGSAAELVTMLFKP
ncbi:VirB2 family type IV secretion system major pilin TrwL [Bartonella sp. MM73XJBT]|uniref:VirB2 family type IV secretion system major pilin TrwL n=1 Tax=Bartonella sp. MM73XJBT TaxID=3019095 RepID=UPI002360A117|nr:VirB2 family type IV secretion system major pilin TrwL [Bartonella sp. MM73XJBT]